MSLGKGILKELVRKPVHLQLTDDSFKSLVVDVTNSFPDPNVICCIIGLQTILDDIAFSIASRSAKLQSLEAVVILVPSSIFASKEEETNLSEDGKYNDKLNGFVNQ